MAGRTERVNANEVSERADGIFFEGDVVRGWLDQLARRTEGALQAAGRNTVFTNERQSEMEELQNALDALKRAQTSLKVFEHAVARREGR